MTRSWIYFFWMCLCVGGCADKEVKLKPGEKYTVDTFMYREYRRLDEKAATMCTARLDSIYKIAYDSIFKLRVYDIMSIRGDGVPPSKNRFPEVSGAPKNDQPEGQ